MTPDMREDGTLAARFGAHRAHLHGIAYRMLGSDAEADDAVQEAWLRLSRNADARIENLAGWLTAVVARICLDMLRTRASRQEESLGALGPEFELDAELPSPDGDLILAESISAALLVVLGTLAPAERLAFVLHDMFGVPFEDIAAIIDRSVLSVRQLASRARRRVQSGARGEVVAHHRREIVAAFLAASREGNFDALLKLLAPDVVLRADAAAATLGATPELRGATAVAGTFSGRARVARVALIDGAVGAVWCQEDRLRIAFEMTITGERISTIALLAAPATLAAMEWHYLD